VNGPGRATPHVLVVEDDPDVLQILCIALQDIGGMKVTACANGQEALTRSQDVAPDLVLLDVMMPEMDGPTLYTRLRALAATRSVPVVFVTAKVAREEIAKLRRLGAAGVITKPFDPVRLPDQVLAIWNGTGAPGQDAAS